MRTNQFYIYSSEYFYAITIKFVQNMWVVLPLCLFACKGRYTVLRITSFTPLIVSRDNVERVDSL